MKGRNILWIALLCLGVFAGGVAVGQDPGLWQRHPVLADADNHCRVAFDKLSEAQAANEWDAGGHLQHAKDLLARAQQEIVAGAIAHDQHR
jgi:hypothetical protein